MRDLVLGLIIIWLTLAAFRRPWVSILGWTWVSVMNAHALSWTLNSMPVAAAIGGSTLIGLFTSADRKNYFWVRENGTLLLFMLWMTITLPFSMAMDEAYPLWVRVMKIDLMILVTMVLLHSKKHQMLLAWVLVFSIGFYGVKGGAFTIATGGSYRVWGPSSTYIEGNNEVALAIVMTIPLMRYLQLQMKLKWAKTVMTVCMLLMASAALGSHSRGALVAIFAMAVVLWWRGKNKLVNAVGFVVIGMALLSLMPEEWFSRMNTIKTYEQDDSAQGRINAWWMAYNLAKANFFGGGFMVALPLTFQLYAPDPTDIHAAHSIYFMVLGEHGFIGLFIFLTLFTMTYLKFGTLRQIGKFRPETQWLSDLGAMGQVSIVGFAVGGAFLSLSYWDFPYNLTVMAVLGQRWIDNKAWLAEKDEALLVIPNWMPDWVKRRFVQS
jgi:putative inorganic carbon (hco3(-)) transporter